MGSAATARERLWWCRGHDRNGWRGRTVPAAFDAVGAVQYKNGATAARTASAALAMTRAGRGFR